MIGVLAAPIPYIIEFCFKGFRKQHHQRSKCPEIVTLKEKSLRKNKKSGMFHKKWQLLRNHKIGLASFGWLWLTSTILAQHSILALHILAMSYLQKWHIFWRIEKQWLTDSVPNPDLSWLSNLSSWLLGRRQVPGGGQLLLRRWLSYRTVVGVPGCGHHNLPMPNMESIYVSLCILHTFSAGFA